MNKKSFTTNLNLQNVSDFSNEKIEKEKKRTIVISANKEIINRFIEGAFSYYRDRNNLKDYSYANYFPLAVKAVEGYLTEELGKLVDPTEDDLAFYKNKVKGGNADEFYDLKDIERINLFVYDSTRNDYYKLMHNYYINKRKGLRSFSVSLFFYDFVEILEKGIL